MAGIHAAFTLMFSPLCATRNILGALAAQMPQAVQVTPEEREAIQRVQYILMICFLCKAFPISNFFIFVL